MVKKIACLCMAVLTVFSLTACSKSSGDDLMVALITDGGAIDDGAVNQAIWQTLESLKDGVGIAIDHAVPKTQDTDGILDAVKKLTQKGANMILMPGYTFADALLEAQILYKDCKFVALDFAPSTLGDSAVSVSFANHEAAFMAGFAAAIRLEQGRFGAILGMDIPAYQQYSWGFQQGVAYANDNFGTHVTMSAGDFKYAGSVTNDSLTQQLAAQMYDSGVDCIFIAAGKAGSGALTEARLRRANGEDIWAVGSEYSQANEGIYDGNNSVIITSAMKRWGDAVIDMVDLALKGKFPGKQVVRYDAKNEGVGVPAGERNLTVDMRETCIELAEKLKKGTVTVSDEWDETLIP